MGDVAAAATALARGREHLLDTEVEHGFLHRCQLEAALTQAADGLGDREHELQGVAGDPVLELSQACPGGLHARDALEDLDDVQHVYANVDISDEEMERLAAG